MSDFGDNSISIDKQLYKLEMMKLASIKKNKQTKLWAIKKFEINSHLFKYFYSQNWQVL